MEIDARLKQLSALREEGGYEDALSLLQQLFAEAELASALTGPIDFILTFNWKILAEQYAPARAALGKTRDDQIERLLAGDLYFGRSDSSGDDKKNVFRRPTRFSLIVQMNETLRDARSTYDLFVRLDATQPELARQYAWQALPAVVESGDFALADHYRGEPLAHLDMVNETALTWSLFPSGGTAPRLAAELTNLVRDVRIAIAVLCGQGHEAESSALREALLAGLESDALRAMAQRELDAAGTITREIVEHQMAQETTDNAGNCEYGIT